MRINVLLVTLLISSLLWQIQPQVQAQDPRDHGKDNQQLPIFEEADLIPLKSLPPLPVPGLYSSPNAPVLPLVVNNSLHPYFRGAYNQAGLSCGQAAFIGYNYTYEVNRLRNLPANVTANQYPTHFAWNWANGGNGWYGASYFHTADLMKHVGTPNVVTYGGMSAGDGIRWMTGYNNYYLAMKNRIYDAYSINVGTIEGLQVLKHYLHDHLEGSPYGGLANFFANQPPLQTLPAGTPEAGKKVVIQWSSFSHALTVVGYNDLIRWDYNGDGQYTNHLDINGDGIVDLRDWEIGGLILVNSYGGVPNWGNGGFAFMMYKTLAEPYGAGGIWNNSVHVMKPKINSEPLLTMKVTLKHDSREKIRVVAGVSLNPYATVPDVETDFPIFNYQGAHRPMQGEYTEEAKTIEFGLDITSLLGYVPSGHMARYFLKIYERDPGNQGTGTVLAYSLMDYTNGVNEIMCPNLPMPVVENGITTLGINAAINYQPFYITTDTLPNAKFYEPYSVQLEADGGSEPYHWFLKMNYDESDSSQPFPNVSTQQLTPTNNTSGYATKALDFSFPFYGKLYDTLFIHVNGVVIFDRQNYPWPYTHEPQTVFKAYKAIAPYNFNLRLYTGQGIWYEGDENSATFRWKASINENTSSELNFAVKLYPNGNIEYYYGSMVFPAETAWIGGLSNGDYRAFQYLSFTASPVIQPNKKIIFTAPDFVPEFSLTTGGVLHGTPTQVYENKMLKFMAVDNNDLFTTKTLSLNTAGLMINAVVHSGDDQIIEFGETATLDIMIKSMEPQAISNATMTLGTDNPYIAMIDSLHQFALLNPGDSVILTNAFSFAVSTQVPDNHPLEFSLVVTSANDSWSRELYLTAHAPNVKPVAVIIQDGSNGVLDPGETADIAIQFKNLGGAAVNNIEIILQTTNPNVTVNAGQASIPGLLPGETQFRTFNITASPNLNPGDIITMTATITGHNDYQTSSPVVIVTSLSIEDFESGSFASYPWQFSGNKPWVIDNAGAWEGTYCAKSGAITHNQSSVMFIEGETLMPDSISFYRKVSSEANYDYLKFYINGALMGQWSGTVSWGRMAYAVSPGSNVFKWEYMKDGSVSNGSDCAWVDYIRFPVMGSCQPPHSLNATNITAHTALLQWFPGNTEMLWNLVYGSPGFDPNTQGVLIENLEQTQYELSGLEPTSFYSFHVRSYCGSGAWSDWSGAALFVTTCDSYLLPFGESFSGASVNCWTFPQGQGNWNFGSTYAPPSSVSGSPNAYFSWDPTLNNYNYSLTSPILSAQNMVNVAMDYLLFINNYDNTNLEQMSVEYKAINDNVWVLLENFTNTGLGSSNAEYPRVNQSLAGMQGKQFQVRFRAHGINSYSINGWALDDVLIHGETNPVIHGDANCDGLVNVLDMVTIVNFIVGMNPQPFCFENADINVDGLINVLDAVLTVNIILGGKPLLYAGLKSQTTHIFLTESGIELESDGTLAGVQFEISGFQPGEIRFELPNHEFRYVINEKKLLGVVFSSTNQPIPAGRIKILSFLNSQTGSDWGNIISGNLNGEAVKTIGHRQTREIVDNHDPVVKIYPNPTSSEFTIDLNLPVASDTRICLLDMMGREILELHDGYLSGGRQRFVVGEGLLPKSGVYVVRIVMQDETPGSAITITNRKVVVCE